MNGAEALEELAQPPRKPADLAKALRTMVACAQDVVNCWSSGDLAGAVNELEEATDDARGALKDARKCPIIPMSDKQSIEYRIKLVEQVKAGSLTLEAAQRLARKNAPLASWASMSDREICERAYEAKDTEVGAAIDELKKRGYTGEEAFHEIMSVWW